MMTTVGVPRIPKSEIFLMHVIGQGSYSAVYLGRIRHRPQMGSLSVKIPKRSTQTEVMTEINLMASLSHPNIIQLIGIGFGESDGSDPGCTLSWMLMNYASRGDLLNFVQNRSDRELDLDEKLWTQLSLGIAQGMRYLHDQLIVHCDLHVKNCFVNQNNVAKLGDFGFSYRLESEAEEARLLSGSLGEVGRPRNISSNFILGVRWKCPEYIPGRNFSVCHVRPGDVWAYGVLLYEFWSEGKVPFYSFDDNWEVTKLITDGKTPLDFDKIQTPPFINEIMTQCFEYSPNNRPTFLNIVQMLQKQVNF